MSGLVGYRAGSRADRAVHRFGSRHWIRFADLLGVITSRLEWGSEWDVPGGCTVDAIACILTAGVSDPSSS